MVTQASRSPSGSCVRRTRSGSSLTASPEKEPEWVEEALTDTMRVQCTESIEDDDRDCDADAHALKHANVLQCGGTGTGRTAAWMSV
jgi:hypothetical protein